MFMFAVAITTMAIISVDGMILAMKIGAMATNDRVYWQLLQSVVILNQIFVILLGYLLNTIKLAHIQFEATSK